MGKISGAPDYCFVSKDKSFFIEVKSKKGRQSDNQKMFEEWCKNKEVNYYVCRNFDECAEVVTKQLEAMS